MLAVVRAGKSSFSPVCGYCLVFQKHTAGHKNPQAIDYILEFYLMDLQL